MNFKNTKDDYSGKFEKCKVEFEILAFYRADRADNVTLLFF
jgi:hypothetical protein